MLQQLIGKWEGSVSTWQRPDRPPLTGEISASFTPILDGRSVLHEYRSNLDEHRSDGMAIIGRDLSDQRLRMTWVDTFHTTTDVMVLAEDASKSDELSLGGSYTAGDETWGWRIVIRPVSDGELVMEHFNIMPSGQENLAVEIKLQRGPAD